MASSKNITVKSPRKLIEVALPLDAINEASVRESFIYRGNPSSLHKWWAQRPLAAARAVIFGQMVNDPSWRWEMDHPGEVPPSNLKASWAASRKRLFSILEDLVKWESTTNDEIIQKARAEIQKSWLETCDINRDHPQASELFNPHRLPILQDPFAGGGTIPLEAQRLGLEAHASDLNPVAVLINKAAIEIPPKFIGKAPVNPTWQSMGQGQKLLQQRQGLQGMVEDLRYYGHWMLREAEKRVGQLYPPIEITAEIAQGRPDLDPLIGKRLPILAWLWARTVKSPNPAFRGSDVPLASTFILSSKVGKEAYVEPIIQGDHYSFCVRLGRPPVEAKDGTKTARGANFRCLLSGTPIVGDYIKAEGIAGRMKARLMAIVAESEQGRIYLSPTLEQEAVAHEISENWKPNTPLAPDLRALWTPLYGLKTFGDLFTARQLTAMTTFSDLIPEVCEVARHDALIAGLSGGEHGANTDATGASAYSESLSVYLAFMLSKMSDYNCALVPWYTKEDRPGHLFSKQAIPMVWDYTELNPFADIGGGFAASCEIVSGALAGCPTNAPPGFAIQCDAVSSHGEEMVIISTDPPYYDNIGYADLSDFFYVWLRRSLRGIFPDLFATMSVPKAEELVATPYRHGSKEKAEEFFLNGMTEVMNRLAKQAHPAFPVTIYYAFKQSESKVEGGTSSTGWETFLDAVNRAGFALSGTWPMRTERGSRSIGIGTNSLASCIVLVCRPRAVDATVTSRRAFLRELNLILPQALDSMTRWAGGDRLPVAPVDLSQAMIGPGMGIFSKYKAVLEADGTPMSVRTALQLINRFLADDDFDPETQFCLQWFETNSWKPGPYGVADVAARAKGTGVDALFRAGVVNSGGGEVQLLRWNELPTDWKPDRASETPVWEALHQLIRNLNLHGEQSAGALLAEMSAVSGPVRTLAYRLYTLCERKGLAEDARPYNELIGAWASIEVVADEIGPPEKQGELF